MIPFSLPVVLALLAPQESSSYEPDVRAPDGAGEAALETMKTPEGFVVELWAEEPMLANPVCLYVTDDGRCFVGETFRHSAGVADLREHMDWLEEDLAAATVADRVAMLKAREGDDFASYGVEHDRIRLIYDRDGDGRADAAEIFADGFQDPAAGIGAGLLEHEGDVYYTCIPDLWKLRDEDGDGRSDERRALSSGYGVHIAMLGHDLHGLRIGPDGRLYFSCGDRGFTVPREDGTIEHAWAGGVLRCELDGSGLEVFASGLRNPQELVFDEYGNLFTGDNNSDSIDRARFVHVVESGDSGWRYSYQWMNSPRARGPWNEEKLWYPHFDGQAAYIIPPIEWLGAGPSGLTYDPGTGLPEEFARHFFLVDFRGGRSYSGVHAFSLTPRGAGFELGEVEPFVWGALATDCDFGPDGALWFCDWVEGWEKTGRGRVYRMFDPAAVKDGSAVDAKRILASGVKDASTTELGRRLAHPNQRVRQAAQLELATRGDAGFEQLRTAALEGADDRERLHGVWGIGHAARRFGAKPDVLLDLLDDSSFRIRAQAIKALADVGFDISHKLNDLLHDRDPRVRAEAALAAGKLERGGAFDHLVEILRETEQSDPILRHAAGRGLAGSASTESLAELRADESPDVRIGAVLALRHKGMNGTDVEAALTPFLVDDNPRVALEAARSLFESDRFGALSEASPTWDIELESDASREEPGLGFRTPFQRRVLAANRILGTERAAARLASFALSLDNDHALRRDAVRLLAEWAEPSTLDYLDGRYRPLGRRDGSYLPALATWLFDEGLASSDEELTVEWIRFCTELEVRRHEPDLIALAFSLERASSVRVAAMEALERIGAETSHDYLERLLADRDAAVRTAALATLERQAPATAVRLVPEIMKHGSIEERRAAFRILGRTDAQQARAHLLPELVELRNGWFPGELALDLVHAARAHAGDVEIAAELERLAEKRAGNETLAPHVDALLGGDSKKGEAVFRQSDLSCQRCHTTQAPKADQAPDEGRVGPTLLGIGQRLTRMELLVSIADPNATITNGYNATVAFLRDGGLVAGRVVARDENTVTLLNADGERIDVAAGEIEEERPDLSAMPNGLLDSIDDTELRDLIAYLASL